MAFPPRFLDEIRARVSLAGAIGRHVKLTRRGREYVGLCPFHKEKTPSFNVVEDKGFYHCFGCGAHGDVIGFTMRAANLSFRDAVEQLAREAGLPVPAETEAETERARHALGLYDVCEAACAFFERQLAASSGAKAADYLGARGVDAAQARKFRLGYAPPSGHALLDALSRDMPLDLIEEAGLVRKEQQGTRRYDFFRDRVIFPILDRRDRVIAFGGRTLGDGQPKYLNSPDTPIFQKGTTLYALNLARKRAADAPVVVVEGYMDVIALHGAGFAGAVAPLGTALTEHQIAEIWRLAPEPVLCFDGDAAGRRAADRAIDRCLPYISATRRLGFVALPEGEDPDSLVRAQGGAAFGRLLAAAKPLSSFLWHLATHKGAFGTPEQVAELEHRIKERIVRIEDRPTQAHFLQFVRDQIWDLRLKQRARAPAEKTALSAELEGLSRTWSETGEAEKIKTVLIATAINHPEVARNDIDRFINLAPRRRDVLELHGAIVRALAENPEIAPDELQDLLKSAGFGMVLHRIFSSATYRAHRFATPVESGEAAVNLGWRAALSRLLLPELRRQLEGAVVQVGNDPSAEDWERMLLLRQIYEDENVQAELMRETGEGLERTREWRPGAPAVEAAGDFAEGRTA